MSGTGEVLGQARRSTIRRTVIGWFVAGVLWSAAAVLVAETVGMPLWGYMVYMLGFGWIIASLGWWGRYPSAYVEGFRDGQESEHYFDQATIYPDPRCVCGALWLSDGSTAGQCGRFVLGREELGEYSAYMDLTYDGVPLCGQVSPPDPYGLQAERMVCTEARETHMPGIHRGNTASGVPYEWRERVT